MQLLNDPKSPDEKKKYIQLSIEELDRANEIIYDFLSFGRPSIDNNGKVEVGSQLERVVNVIQGYVLHHNVEIKVNLVDNCWIYANSQKLSQSLINI